jgi:hypothetical protein
MDFTRRSPIVSRVEKNIYRKIFSEYKARHSLVGLQSGALLAIGGSNREADIWKLSQGSWSALGKLKEVSKILRLK